MTSLSSDIYQQLDQKLESLQKYTSKKHSIDSKVELINIQIDFFQHLDLFNHYERALLLDKIKDISKKLYC